MITQVTFKHTRLTIWTGVGQDIVNFWNTWYIIQLHKRNFNTVSRKAIAYLYFLNANNVSWDHNIKIKCQRVKYIFARSKYAMLENHLLQLLHSSLLLLKPVIAPQNCISTEYSDMPILQRNISIHSHGNDWLKFHIISITSVLYNSCNKKANFCKL